MSMYCSITLLSIFSTSFRMKYSNFLLAHKQKNFTDIFVYVLKKNIQYILDYIKNFKFIIDFSTLGKIYYYKSL